LLKARATMRRVVLLVMLSSAMTLGCAQGILSPFRPFPATAITVASTDVRPYHATIIWRVANGSTAPYPIERRNAAEPWKHLTHLYVEGGLLVLEDLGVLPGQSYTYRVRLGRDAASAAVGEVTVNVPG
jgi:hypothetical protein